MTYDTLNDAVTMQGNGEGSILANRYRIVRQLGQGGMSSVWLAEDTQLDNKPFAIKMLPSVLVSNKRAYRQLKDEALVAMKLTHPNIVTLRAFEENNGNPFLVMDYIDGQTLDDYLAEKGKLSEDETIRLLKPIAAALDYAHGEGVVHRDVKPANVMIRKDGHPFILDFGIAREIQETMTRVTGKLSSGTLLYMSPEQLRGLPPKASQDVYSFAAMAYECLKGEPPFSRGQVEYQILNEKPAPLPEELRVSASVMRGLSKSPEGRLDTCAKVLSAASLTRQPPPVRVKVGKPPMRVVAPEVARPSEVRESNAARLIRPIVFILVALAMFAGAVWYRNARRQEEARKRAIAEQQAEAARLRQEEEKKQIEEAERKKKREEDLARQKEKERKSIEARRIEEERLAKEAVSAIIVEAKVQKGKVGRMSQENGFKRKIEETDDLFIKAEALYAEKKWRDAAVVFTNHVTKCKELVALDVQRQDALQRRKSAQAAFREAESKGAKTYDADNWNEAVGVWQNATSEFNRMEFAPAATLFDDAASRFADTGRVAQSKKRIAEEERLAEEKRIAEAKQAEERRRAEAAQAAENKRRQEERRRAMQSLPGKWMCTAHYKGSGFSHNTRYELDFMNDGGYVERRVVGDDVTYTSTGTWVQTGNVLKVHINSMVVRSETYNYTYTDPKDYTYNILWKDDGRFELRYEIENWKKNRKKFSSEATCYYDSDGTFRSQETIKQLFTTQTVIFSETAKIFSRVYN